MRVVLRPKSDATSGRSCTSKVGLLGLTLESRSTRPEMPRIFSMACTLMRSSSRVSVPKSENWICLPPPIASSKPTWVTVMPGTLARRWRSTADSASTLRLRCLRSTNRM